MLNYVTNCTVNYSIKKGFHCNKSRHCAYIIYRVKNWFFFKTSYIGFFVKHSMLQLSATHKTFVIVSDEVLIVVYVFIGRSCILGHIGATQLNIWIHYKFWNLTLKTYCLKINLVFGMQYIFNIFPSLDCL